MSDLNLGCVLCVHLWVVYHDYSLIRISGVIEECGTCLPVVDSLQTLIEAVYIKTLLVYKLLLKHVHQGNTVHQGSILQPIRGSIDDSRRGCPRDRIVMHHRCDSLLKVLDEFYMPTIALGDRLYSKNVSTRLGQG